MEPGRESPPDSAWGPLEQFEAVFSRRVRALRNLGDEEKVALYTRAYEIARARLEAAVRGEG